MGDKNPSKTSRHKHKPSSNSRIFASAITNNLDTKRDYVLRRIVEEKKNSINLKKYNKHKIKIPNGSD